MTDDERRKRNAACKRRTYQLKRDKMVSYLSAYRARVNRYDSKPLPRDLIEHIDGIIKRELALCRTM